MKPTRTFSEIATVLQGEIDQRFPGAGTIGVTRGASDLRPMITRDGPEFQTEALSYAERRLKELDATYDIEPDMLGR